MEKGDTCVHIGWCTLLSGTVQIRMVKVQKVKNSKQSKQEKTRTLGFVVLDQKMTSRAV